VSARPPGSGDALAPVRGYLARAPHLVVGLMTGTSADALDAALVRFDGHGLAGGHAVLAWRESPLETALRHEVLAVAAAETLAPERLMRLDAALGEHHAAAVLDLLVAAGVAPRDVSAIGAHGQTVRHVPRTHGAEALTLQLGSAAVLAERTGITVVSDFRSRDTAAGGEGAPLVPLYDWWCYRSHAEARVLLNLGGMANVTHLPRGCGPDAVIAFDTGPGNAVLDALASLASGGAEARDEGGARAACGRPDAALLAEALADPFFAQPPPRSTGRERFGPACAARLLERCRAAGRDDADAFATAVELTAVSVADAILRHLVPRGGVDRVIASGGGVRNPTLLGAIARRLAPIPLAGLESLGGEPAAKEAVAFAFLAHQTLCGRAGNLPGATGARHPVVLGRVTPGGLP
jgi:anhydro-N-acetylmuramic acid kinase